MRSPSGSTVRTPRPAETVDFRFTSILPNFQSAAEAGAIRQDVEAADLLQAMSGIYSAPDTPDWTTRALRLVSLILDGLRTGAPKAAAPGS